MPDQPTASGAARYEVHICEREPAEIGKPGWRVICRICGPIGNPPGRVYPRIGTARQVSNRHYWRSRVVTDD